MRNIKVICTGSKCPSGKRNGVEFMISEAELKEYEKIKSFGLNVVEMPKPKSKAKPKDKKKSEK
tara:strand:- start:70 stop:261 length:192 start_codon:yes stop_codon:yes gene_type:complete